MLVRFLVILAYTAKQFEQCRIFIEGIGSIEVDVARRIQRPCEIFVVQGGGLLFEVEKRQLNVLLAALSEQIHQSNVVVRLRILWLDI